MRKIYVNVFIFGERLINGNGKRQKLVTNVGQFYYFCWLPTSVSTRVSIGGGVKLLWPLDSSVVIIFVRFICIEKTVCRKYRHSSYRAQSCSLPLDGGTVRLRHVDNAKNSSLLRRFRAKIHASSIFTTNLLSAYSIFIRKHVRGVVRVKIIIENKTFMFFVKPEFIGLLIYNSTVLFGFRVL